MSTISYRRIVAKMTSSSSILFWFVMLSNVILILGYNLLVFCPLPLKSHYSLCKSVVDVFVDRGHEVSFISPYKAEKNNFTDINVSEIIHEKENHVKQDFKNSRKITAFDSMKKITLEQIVVYEKIFSNERVKNLLLDKTQKFDAVIFDYFINEMTIGFGVKYDCPVIPLSSVNLMNCLAGMTNNPMSIAIVPNIFSSYTGKMDIWQRTWNFLSIVMQETFRMFFIQPTQSLLYEKYFPDESKKVPFNELVTRISGVLLNSHPSIGIARPLLPNTIEIGGYHIKDPDLLPTDFKKILDDSKDGFIYFSMGSNLKSRDMSPDTKSTLLKVFSTLKQTVVWKYEEDLSELPKNIIIKSWMPQTSILAHPNIKLFISHGGLLSCTEAAHFGVPLLAIPMFADQNHNAKSLQERGNGIMLEFINITELSFKWALEEVLENPKYAEKAKEVHGLYHDRPMKPRDLLVYHVEHIIRSKGATHLTPPPLSRFSHLLLDIIGVIFMLLFLFNALLLYLAWKFYKYYVKYSKTSNKTIKKQ